MNASRRASAARSDEPAVHDDEPVSLSARRSIGLPVRRARLAARRRDLRVPADGLRRQREGRLLVERGDVVAHPDLVGAHPDWRYLVGHSFGSIEDWKGFLKRSIRTGRLGLVTSSLAPVSLLAFLAVGAVGYRHRVLVASGARSQFDDLRLRGTSPSEIPLRGEGSETRPSRTTLPAMDTAPLLSPACSRLQMAAAKMRGSP
jgi:hypothetical protein